MCAFKICTFCEKIVGDTNFGRKYTRGIVYIKQFYKTIHGLIKYILCDHQPMIMSGEILPVNYEQFRWDKT